MTSRSTTTTLPPPRPRHVRGLERARRLSGVVTLALALACAVTACRSAAPTPAPAGPAASARPATPAYPTIGRVERLDPALDALIAPDAKIEMLAQGFAWAEGPVWTTEGGGALLFSDVPNNVIHRWKDGGEGITDFLRPGGYTRRRSARRQPGPERPDVRRSGSPHHLPARRSARGAP